MFFPKDIITLICRHLTRYESISFIMATGKYELLTVKHYHLSIKHNNYKHVLWFAKNKNFKMKKFYIYKALKVLARYGKVEDILEFAKINDVDIPNLMIPSLETINMEVFKWNLERYKIKETIFRKIEIIFYKNVYNKDFWEIVKTIYYSKESFRFDDLINLACEYNDLEFLKKIILDNQNYYNIFIQNSRIHDSSLHYIMENDDGWFPDCKLLRFIVEVSLLNIHEMVNLKTNLLNWALKKNKILLGTFTLERYIKSCPCELEKYKIIKTLIENDYNFYKEEIKLINKLDYFDIKLKR